MKLSEVTLRKTHLIFEDDADTRMPEIDTTAELNGKTYKWRGQMWTEVNPTGGNGRPAPSGVGTQLTAQWRTSNPVPRGVFKLTPGVQQVSNNRFMVTLPDTTTVVETDSLANANAIQQRVDELDGKTPRQITTAIEADTKSGALKSTKFTRSWSLGRAVRNMNIADFEKMTRARNSIVGKLLSSRLFRIVIGFAGNAAMIIGMFAEIENVQIEIEEAEANGGDVQRLQDIKSILVGQAIAAFAAQVIAMLARTRTVKLLLTPLRAIIRGGQVATALTGVGAPAAFLSLIVTEALWIVIPLILSTSSVQRWIAEIIVDSTFKDIFVNTGRSTVGVVNAADQMLNGRFGTGALAKALNGFDPTETEGVTGEYYSESEWAKLVFGPLLFPPNQESMLVPYIPSSRRNVLLAGTMDLNPMDADDVTNDGEDDTVDTSPSAGANPETSSDPGMPINPDAQAGPQ